MMVLTAYICKNVQCMFENTRVQQTRMHDAANDNSAVPDVTKDRNSLKFSIFGRNEQRRSKKTKITFNLHADKEKVSNV